MNIMDRFSNFLVDRAKKGFLVRRIQVLGMGVKSFFASKHLIQATALTYYTLFAIVPLAALMFGFAKGFGFDEKLRTYISTQLLDKQDTVVQNIYEYADRTIQNASGGVIAGIGVLVLLWTVMRLASNIEEAFNMIWHVQKGRTVFRKFSDFLSIILIAPFLLVVMGSGTVYARHVADKLQQLAAPTMFLTEPFLTWILPIMLAWVFFIFIYLFVPNTHIRIRSAVYGGLIAAVLYHCVQLAYFNILIKLNSYNSIYASFSALPLFLIWVQWMWLITLLGAEVTFVDQHYESGQFDKRLLMISEELRYKYMLTICAVVIQMFDRQETPPTEYDITERTGFPLFRVRESLSRLVECGLLRRADVDGINEYAYIPGVSPDILTVGKAFEIISRFGLDDTTARNQKDFKALSSALEKIRDAGFASSGNRFLREL